MPLPATEWKSRPGTGSAVLGMGMSLLLSAQETLRIGRKFATISFHRQLETISHQNHSGSPYNIAATRFSPSLMTISFARNSLKTSSRFSFDFILIAIGVSCGEKSGHSGYAR